MNTLSNIGGTWPVFFVYSFIDIATTYACLSNNGDGKRERERERGRELEIERGRKRKRKRGENMWTGD